MYIIKEIEGGHWEKKNIKKSHNAEKLEGTLSLRRQTGNF